MGIETHRDGDRRRLLLSGELCIGFAAELKPALLAGLDEVDGVEVDLAGVTEIDSAGYQLLALLKREGAAAGKRVSFVGHSPAVLRLFDIFNAVPAFADPVVIACAASRP